MNLRKPCEDHGRYDSHYWQSPDTRLWELKGGLCPGGTEPTIDELLAMLVEEGVLERNTYRSESGGWLTIWQEVTS